jgi:branched-chain amino acid transport system permease protein
MNPALVPVIFVPVMIFLLSLLMSPSYQRITVLFLIYAGLSLSWIVVFKMGYVSLGSAAFYGAGAYIFVYLTKWFPTLPYHVDILLPIPLIAFIAAVVGYATMRLAGIFFIFATFAAAEALRQIFLYYEINHTGFVGKVITDSLPTVETLGLLCAVLVIAGLLFYSTTIPKFRIVVDYIREDEELARVAGVNTLKYKIVFFTIASVIQGLVGSISAWYLAYIDPDLVFNPMISIQVLVIGLLGGSGNILGPVVASALLVYLSEQLIRVASHLYLIVLGISVILVAKFMKKGFSGFIDGIWQLWKSGMEKRKGG